MTKRYCACLCMKKIGDGYFCTNPRSIHWNKLSKNIFIGLTKQTPEWCPLKIRLVDYPIEKIANA